MQAVMEKLELANIMNLKIVPHNEQYYILAEWSRDAIEAFNEYEDAQAFVRGFVGNEDDGTLAYNKGKIFRSCVEEDIKEFGATYYKVNELSRY